MLIGLDTNILVHATLIEDKGKHEKAKRFLEEIVPRGNYLISLQVAAEYYATIIRIAPNLAEEARELIEIIATPETTVHYNLETLNQALEKAGRRGKFWDTLIALTYLREGAEAIATENERDFKDIIKVINPLR